MKESRGQGPVRIPPKHAADPRLAFVVVVVFFLYIYIYTSSLGLEVIPAVVVTTAGFR